MTDKPLLILPSKNAASKIPVPLPIPDTLHKPEFREQYKRLEPLFQNLTSAFITSTPDNLQPEYVLVIETVGRFDKFMTIVSNLSGMGWLGEIDIDEDPDELFYDSGNPNKKIDGRLFLSTTNQQAMNENF